MENTANDNSYPSTSKDQNIISPNPNISPRLYDESVISQNNNLSSTYLHNFKKSVTFETYMHII